MSCDRYPCDNTLLLARPCRRSLHFEPRPYDPENPFFPVPVEQESPDAGDAPGAREVVSGPGVVEPLVAFQANPVPWVAGVADPYPSPKVPPVRRLPEVPPPRACPIPAALVPAEDAPADEGQLLPDEDPGRSFAWLHNPWGG